MRLLALLTILLLSTTGSATAGAQTGNATAFLKKRHAEVTALLKHDASTPEAQAERDGAMRQALSSLLDFQELAKRALDKHWAERNEADRERFVRLLSQLVERSYQKNLESTMDFQVTYEAAKKRGDSIHVATHARSMKNRRAPAIEIEYTLVPTESSYKVYDVTTDGVSLVANYQRQFNKIIRRHGWDALIERMETKLESDGETF